MDTAAASANSRTRLQFGFCNHYTQLSFLCALEVIAGLCLWWAQSTEYATLVEPRGCVLTWSKSLTTKSKSAKTRQMFSRIEKSRLTMGLAILIVAGCYLSGTAIYTFSLARAHHRLRTVEARIDKLSDSWLVRFSIVIYVLSSIPALILSAWLGFGVYFGPKLALSMLGLSFEETRRGVQMLIASATLIPIALLWRLVALCLDIHRHNLKKAADSPDLY